MLELAQETLPLTENLPAYDDADTLTISHKRLNILLVEDVIGDAMLVKKALDATRIPFSLFRARRGDEVLSRIHSTRVLAEGDRFDLILLDLGLPGMDGFEILAELAQMPASIRQIPIVILTAHQHFEYMSITYPHLHILSYLNKPCDVEELRQLLGRVQKNSAGLKQY